MIHSIRPAAFTLLELLIVIAIIAGLVGLTLPHLDSLRQRAQTVACASNLHQIGLAALTYSGENNNKLPVIEPWPASPLYPASDGVKNILEVLGAYGITTQTLTCRADVAGPNYLAAQGSSYEWCPIANGQNLQSTTLTFGNLPQQIKLSDLLLAFDYSNLHNARANVLFGDGHVAGAVAN